MFFFFWDVKHQKYGTVSEYFKPCLKVVKKRAIQFIQKLTNLNGKKANLTFSRQRKKEGLMHFTAFNENT